MLASPAPFALSLLSRFRAKSLSRTESPSPWLGAISLCRERWSMTKARASDVVVIGGGIVGACVAHALCDAGARVTLLTEGRPGRGTSAASLAWVNAANKPPEAYHR